MHISGNIAFHFGTLEQRVKAFNFNICKKLPKLIGYYNNVPWAAAKLMSVFIIPIHISTKSEKLV